MKWKQKLEQKAIYKVENAQLKWNIYRNTGKPLPGCYLFLLLSEPSKHLSLYPAVSKVLKKFGLAYVYSPLNCVSS